MKSIEQYRADNAKEDATHQSNYMLARQRVILWCEDWVANEAEVFIDKDLSPFGRSLLAQNLARKLMTSGLLKGG